MMMVTRHLLTSGTGGQEEDDKETVHDGHVSMMSLCHGPCVTGEVVATTEECIECQRPGPGEESRGPVIAG